MARKEKAAKKEKGARKAKRSPLALLLLPANLLTLSRILLVPLIVALWFGGSENFRLLAALLFVLAGLTDLLDGIIARSGGQQTRIGAYLDPVADKVLVLATLILLVQHFAEPPWLLIPAILIIVRETAVSALRELAALLNRSADVQVSLTAKSKTTLQMISIGGLMFCGYSGLWMREMVFVASTLLLYLAAAVSLWSFMQYVFQARRWLMEDAKGQE